jgi:hypothetical protein
MEPIKAPAPLLVCVIRELFFGFTRLPRALPPSLVQQKQTIAFVTGERLLFVNYLACSIYFQGWAC